MSHGNSHDAPLLEAQLLVLAQSGDPVARDEIVKRLGGIERICGHLKGGGMMLTLARNALSTYHLADNYHAVQDVVEESYLSILEPETARYDHLRGTVTCYLVGLVRNAARRTARLYTRAWRSGVEEMDWGQDQINDRDAADEVFCDPPSVEEGWTTDSFDADTPDTIMIERERQGLLTKRIAQAMGMESPDLQDAMTQHYCMDVPISALADRFGTERTGLGRRMAACRDRLSRRLRDFCVTSLNN